MPWDSETKTDGSSDVEMAENEAKRKTRRPEAPVWTARVPNGRAHSRSGTAACPCLVASEEASHQEAPCPFLQGGSLQELSESLLFGKGKSQISLVKVTFILFQVHDKKWQWDCEMPSEQILID